MTVLRGLFIFGLLPWISLSTIAAEPDAKVRTSIATKGELWVGQRIVVAVEVLTPGLFSGVPAFDLPEVTGLILFPPEGSPVLGSETIDDVSYTSQRHELSVFPQRAGAIEIPKFAIRFESSTGFGQPTVDRRVTTDNITLTIDRPPGTKRWSALVTSDDLTVTENWTPEPSETPVNVGTAYTRTITIRAHDIPGMLLPAIPADSPEGLKAYPSPPIVQDHTERGELTGQRVDKTIFVCEHAGSYTLPQRTIAWWNLAEKRLQQKDLPERTFAVIAPAPTDSSNPPEPLQASNRLYVVDALSMVLVAVIFFWRLVGRRHLPAARTIEIAAEAARFRDFTQACRLSDAAAISRTMFAWLDSLPADWKVNTMAEFATRADNKRLSDELKNLEMRRYGRLSCAQERWSADELLRQVRLARHRLRHSAQGAKIRLGLPPLNPVSRE